MTDTLWIGDPRVGPPTFGKGIYPTLDTLAGKTLAIFNNSWTSMDEIAQVFGDAMVKRYGVANVIHYGVPIASAVDPELLEDAARKADAAIVGLAN